MPELGALVANAHPSFPETIRRPGSWNSRRNLAVALINRSESTEKDVQKHEIRTLRLNARGREIHSRQSRIHYSPFVSHPRIGFTPAAFPHASTSKRNRDLSGPIITSNGKLRLIRSSKGRRENGILRKERNRFYKDSRFAELFNIPRGDGTAAKSTLKRPARINFRYAGKRTYDPSFFITITAAAYHSNT